MKYFLLLISLQLSFFGLMSQSPERPNPIRLNQIGYYPTSAKNFVLADVQAKSFTVVNSKNKRVFKGELIDKGTWEPSGERIMLGNFSGLKKPGVYTISIEGVEPSYQFEIKKGLYHDALDASIKSFTIIY